MFIIQPINKFYNNRRFVGIHSDTNLPYIVYDGNPDCPSAIHDFESVENAVDWLTNFIQRKDIDTISLSISQVVDLSLVNNANQFVVHECDIVDGELKITTSYPQTQFDRNNWYKG